MNYTVILRRPDWVGDDYKLTIQYVTLDAPLGLDVAELVEKEARHIAALEDEEARPSCELEPDDYDLVAIFAGHHVAMEIGK